MGHNLRKRMAPKYVKPNLIGEFEWQHVQGTEEAISIALHLFNVFSCSPCLQEMVHHLTMRF